MELKGAVALVLGGIKGIGKAVGLALAKEGVTVALPYHDWQESLDRMKADFLSTGGDHLITPCNLLETEAIPSLIEKIIHQYGRLDILINNIERGGMPIVHGPYTQDQWDLEMETTLRAKQWVFESAFPHLMASKDAAVINFSSIAGICGRTGPASLLFNEGYAAANRGVSLLTETWARMGAPSLRVNEIMLGIFDTRHAEGTRGWGLLSEKEKEAIRAHILLQRTGKLDDIVKAVLFILKDATYMTGSVLRLDGGYVLGGEKIGAMPPGVL